MATDPLIDPSTATPIEGESPTETEEPSSDATPTVEELQEKLTAAENEAKTWKGRAEKATKGEKPKEASVSEEELDWKIANTNRISLVKDSYQKHLDELQALGAKPTLATRDKALQLAESDTGVTKGPSEPSDEVLPMPTVDRSGTSTPKLTATDVALGVKPETIKEYRDYVEGR